MPQIREKTDEAYMYKFRTNICSKSRCRNPSKCFDAHSKIMKRRVPKLNKHGFFNYIPEVCEQWKTEKKCILGDKCLRSHGWLERIFHPLLFKTKICKSIHKNGICPEYGAYCAFAQNPNEIRNLVEIYGDDWKQHYDLSGREEKCRSPDSGSDKKTNNMFKWTTRNQPKQRLTKKWKESEWKESEWKESEGLVGHPDSPRVVLSSPLLIGTYGFSNLLANFSIDDQVTSYVQLYNDNVAAGDWNKNKNSTLRLNARTLEKLSNMSTLKKEEYKMSHILERECHMESKVSRDEYRMANVESKLSDVDKENEMARDPAFTAYSLFSQFNFGVE